MKLKHFFFYALIAFFISCGKKTEKATTKYYVISKQDSIFKKSTVPPPPPPDLEMKFYSDIVFVLGNNNKVYIYQTEKVYNFSKEEFYETESPNFINLKPEHLITIDSENFISFIKNNNDILKFGQSRYSKFLCVASEKDTIKNTAFYDMIDFMNSKESNKRIVYLVRKTTEEENNVLKCKKNNKEYLPEKINWSQKFLNNKFNPLSKEYKKLESEIRILRKAKPTFENFSNEIIPTL